jgi:hypothetical protein
VNDFGRPGVGESKEEMVGWKLINQADPPGIQQGNKAIPLLGAGRPTGLPLGRRRFYPTGRDPAPTAHSPRRWRCWRAQGQARWREEEIVQARGSRAMDYGQAYLVNNNQSHKPSTTDSSVYPPFVVLLSDAVHNMSLYSSAAGAAGAARMSDSPLRLPAQSYLSCGGC